MIELRRLRYLVVLAKRLNYSRAANELGLSQSALTRAIQLLEREVGMRLFDRGQSGVRLTEQGRWMVEKAETLLVNASEFNRQLMKASKGGEGRVRFGMSPLAAHALLPAVLRGRLAHHPTFSHDVCVQDTERLSLMLAKGELEFVVSEAWDSRWPLPAGLPITTESVGVLCVSLIVRRSHPVSHLGEPVCNYPLLINQLSSPWGKLAVELAPRLGAAIQIVEDIGVAAALTRSSDAMWLCAPQLVDSQIHAGELRDMGLPDGTGAVGVELSIHCPLRRSLSPTACELLDAFRFALTTSPDPVQ